MPNTAAALPEISDDGLTWTITVKPGIYFADDPAFKGKKRELTAADYVYSMKRILDPKMRSNAARPSSRAASSARDAVLAQARETGKFDYDAPIEGLQAIDRYTLPLQAQLPDYELLSNLDDVADRRRRARGGRGLRRRDRAGRWPTRSAPGPTG